MRQFFSINPDLVKNHFAATRSSWNNPFSGRGSPLSFSMTPSGKIIKKESITQKIAKSKLLAKVSIGNFNLQNYGGFII